MSTTPPLPTTGLRLCCAAAAAQCAAVAWELGVRSHSSLSSLLLEHGVGGITVHRIDLVSAWLHGLTTALLLLAALGRPLPRLRHVQGVAALAAAAWIATEAWADAATEGHRLSAVREWAVGAPLFTLEFGAVALRIALPLVVAAGLVLHRDPIPTPRGQRFLRLAAAATFAAHGVEALAHHPTFEEYLAAFTNLTLGLELEYTTLRTALTTIGWLDLAVATAVLIRPSWPVLLWMGGWGAITAGARVIHGGPGATSQVFLRAAHIAVPLLCAWWLWRSAGRRPDEAAHQQPRRA